MKLRPLLPTVVELVLLIVLIESGAQANPIHRVWNSNCETLAAGPALGENDGDYCQAQSTCLSNGPAFYENSVPWALGPYKTLEGPDALSRVTLADSLVEAPEPGSFALIGAALIALPWLARHLKLKKY